MPIPRMASRHAMNPVEESIEPISAPSGSDATDPAEADERAKLTTPSTDSTYAGRVETPTWREARVPHAAAVMLALCATAFCAILYIGRNLDFYYDEWSFIGTAASWRLRDYFVPHNEHWSTVPMVIYKVLLKTVGMHSYLPFLAVLLLMHVCAAFLLFLIIRRRCGDVLALCAAGVLLFLGRGSADLLWAFQMGFLGSVVFGLLAIYLLGGDEVPSRRRAAGASAALLLGLMSSGIGLFFFAMAAVDLLLDRRRRKLLWVHVVPGVAYVWWYLAFGRQGTAGDPSPFHDPIKTLEGLLGYTPTGIGTAAAGVFALSSLWGPIALAGLTATAAVLWYRNRLDSGLSIPAALGIVSQYTFTGLVRAQYGSEQATASRYIYIGGVFVLLILAEALRDLRWLGWWRTVAPFTAVCVVAGGIGVLRHDNGSKMALMRLQKEELEITWLFRDAPSLDRGVVLDRQLLPVVSPAIYIDARKHYGSELPTVTVADLGGMPPQDVNTMIRRLLPLAVTQTNGEMPSGATCRSMTIGQGARADLLVPDGDAASIAAIGRHAASRVMFATWFQGTVADGGYQQSTVSSGHGLRLGFAKTGLGVRWHFTLANSGGSDVSVCVGPH